MIIDTNQEDMITRKERKVGLDHQGDTKDQGVDHMTNKEIEIDIIDREMIIEGEIEIGDIERKQKRRKVEVS